MPYLLSTSALIFWIPSRIISLRVLLSFSQQYFKSRIVCSSARIFSWMSFGFSDFGLPYFCAYMVAMVVGECINFPIQRNFVFRSKGNLVKQIAWYVVAFCLITCIVNSINCVWVAVAGLLVPDFIYNIGTTVLNGGISMVIFFFVNKIIFPEGAQAK